MYCHIYAGTEIPDIEAYTKTAGAYILYNGYFLFMVGFGNRQNENILGVVRFGGHRENGESVNQCVIREIKEETSLELEFFDNSVIYTEKDENNADRLEKAIVKEKQNPVYIRADNNNKLSIMYLTYGKGELKPDTETQGILLLRKEDIQTICSKKITLGEYKKNGGKIIFANPLPDDANLSPYNQLKFLNRLFIMEPELMEKFISSSATV